VRLRTIFIVYRKEFRDLLRDRRTLFGMLVFPLIFFPLITVGFNRLEKGLRERAKAEQMSIAILGEEHAPELATRIAADERFLVEPAGEDYIARISDKKLRAAVEFPAGFAAALAAGASPPVVKVYVFRAELRSEEAAKRLEELLEEYRVEVVEQRLTGRGYSAGLLHPLEVMRENAAQPEKVARSKFGLLLPYFIIFLCLTGAMSTVVDLTAGEKERGTMETLLASAAGRTELVLGKFFVVVTSALTTTVLSLASFAFSVRLAGGYGQLGTAEAMYSISPAAIGLVFLLTVPVAVLFAGALMATCVLAKNYKEGQSYAGFAMIFVIFPAMVSVIPGIELNTVLAMIPLVNVSLLSRELFTGVFPWGSLVIVFVSSAVYAAIALAVAVYQFRREEVLFRE
jgi:sodium transport system permease protein